MSQELRAKGLGFTRQAQRLTGALRSVLAGLRKTRARRGPNADSCEHSSVSPDARSADDLGGGGTDTVLPLVPVPPLVGDSTEIKRLRARIDELELELAYAQARTTALQRDDWNRMLASGDVPNRRALINVLRRIARANGMQGGGGALHWS
jgi:hypothetical protein